MIERRRDRDKEREEIEREIERKKTEALRKCNNVLTRLLLRTRTNIDNIFFIILMMFVSLFDLIRSSQLL